jgi:hypothetical protein
VQRAAGALRFDLDRAQPLERTSGHDLSSRTVGAWQDDQQVVICGPPDPVEAAQFAPQRAGDVGDRLLTQLAAVLARQLVEVVDLDQQAAQLRAVAFGTDELLLQTLAQRRWRQAVDLARRESIGARVKVAGSHACSGRVYAGVWSLLDRSRRLCPSEIVRASGADPQPGGIHRPAARRNRG